jgi:acyl-CoA thioester hydrolase
MQEAALDASAAVGWDLARYQAIGQHWLIRETQIDYLQPFFYNDAVVIKTWADDFRRVRSRRVYEFRREGSEVLHARAETEWVYLDSTTGRPASIPPEMIADFAPEGIAETGEARAKFPEAPPPPSEVFRLRKRVEWRDIDTEGHVNNAAYFSYLEDCSTQVGRHFGWSMQRNLDAGFVMVLRELRMVYLQPAKMDDDVEIACWLSDTRRVSALRHYLVTRVGDGETLAKGRSLWVCFDMAKQRPMKFPEDFARDFASNIVP